MWTVSPAKLRLPRPDEALPGRAATMPVAPTHAVLGNPMTRPFPGGIATAMFGLGCFWGAERKFWQTAGVWTTAVGYAGGLTPNPTYEEVCSGKTGHNEVVLVGFDPTQVDYARLLQVFWDSHDPTQGMRQGNDVGTQYRSGVYVFDAAQRAAAEASPGRVRAAPGRRRVRADHHRDRRRAGLLLRRGLPPAVPAQEPARLLRARRHRRELPHRNRRL
jgi:peptide-methionine (S)-S-oxide reductase